jgi:hypothetical protein
MTLKEKYAHLPIELREKCRLIDVRAYMNGDITLEELEEREYPLERDRAARHPPVAKARRRLNWWAVLDCMFVAALAVFLARTLTPDFMQQWGIQLGAAILNGVLLSAMGVRVLEEAQQ